MRTKPRPVESHTLPGMAGDVAAQAEAAAVEQAAELTDRMRQPRPSIDRAAGEMERNSPLFYGTGSNPTLF